jgi:hypothetical protein
MREGFDMHGVALVSVIKISHASLALDSNVA